MMLNITYSEILKLKRSNYMFMFFISALGIITFMNIVILITGSNRSFESYSFNIQQMNFLIIFTIVFCIMASYSFIREYNEKTANTLYSYPFSRIKIFIGKLFVIYMMIMAVYLIQCIFMYLSYYKLFGFLEKDKVVLSIKVNIYSMLFQMSSIPIVILIGNLKRNIIMPIGYGILTIIANGFCDNKYISQIKYNLFIGSVSVCRYFHGEENLDIRSIAIASITLFLVSTPICIYHFCKTDMN